MAPGTEEEQGLVAALGLSAAGISGVPQQSLCSGGFRDSAPRAQELSLKIPALSTGTVMRQAPGRSAALGSEVLGALKTPTK